MGDRQYGEWLRARGSAKTGGERGGSTEFRKPESKGNEGTFLNPQHVAESLGTSGQSVGEKRDGQYSCKNLGQQMALEVEMGTSTSNRRNQNSPSGWDNTAGRRSDLKHVFEKGNQSKETQLDLVRKQFIQKEDDVASTVKRSGPSLVSFSPIKPMEKLNAKEDNSNQNMGPNNEGKGLSKGNWKRLAREKEKAQDVETNAEAHEVSKKRGGNLEALLEAEGIDKKRLCEGKKSEGNQSDSETAVSALQHRREQ
ncbi:hypothetical protein SO802_007292 [Lithocarpus litseifolius]|uniref:Uncharacterized protein n=1 Tax=Lithocarpus litseifolius TaxID=425828 RepID=A0AAW2DPX6_9ROSI